MKAELVALRNPYTDDLSAGLPVQLLFEGAPRAEALVTLFARHPDGGVEASHFRTDADGIALLPVHLGVEYLVDSVVILPLEGGGAGPVWQSHWASLTFEVARQGR